MKKVYSVKLCPKKPGQLSCSHPTDGSHCPVVTLKEKVILIEDDFGGKVKLTQEQFELLQKLKK